MAGYGHQFHAALSKLPKLRTDNDLRTIYTCLRRLDIFQNLNDAALRAICRSARFETHFTNSILFRKGQLATCWYILLTGAVFMDKQMYLPRGCFGKRTNQNHLRRPNDCVVLEPSEMIVIDYPDVQRINVQRSDLEVNGPRKAIKSLNFDDKTNMASVTVSGASCSAGTDSSDGATPTSTLTRVSSAAGVTGKGLPRTYETDVGRMSGEVVCERQGPVRAKSVHSDGTEDLFAGLPEAAVDSEEEEDEESCPSHDSFHELRDNVRECLEKEPEERSEDDLAILLDFMQHMPALSSLPMSVKRELCLKMVFAVVPEAGTVVMKDKEHLDSWSVIVNGQVEIIRPDGQRLELGLGDCFGAEPRHEKQLHIGQMRTIVDDCEFVLVEHDDYCSIMSKVHEHIEKHADKLTGEIVSETEKRLPVLYKNFAFYFVLFGLGKLFCCHCVEYKINKTRLY